jgi:Xaa-Pro aminopeptidase
MILDDPAHVSESELHGRLDRVRAEMAVKKIRTLAVYDSAQHDMTRMDPLFYLTDFYAVGPCWLLVPLEGRPTLFVTPAWDAPRARGLVAYADVVPADANGLMRLVGNAVANAAGPVALSGRDALSVRAAESFGDLASLQDENDIIPLVAAVKSAVEIARIARAAEMADAGFATLREVARVGMREYELSAEVEATMKALGASDNFGLIAGGSHNTAVRGATERRLEAGDVIVGEITPAFHGYHAQLCRTFILGEPTPKQIENYNILIEAERQAFAAALPGQSSSAIARAANRVISDGGYPEFCRAPYMRTRGHGLGRGAVIPGDLDPEGGVTLEEGMTFVIHPNQYFPDTGYLMLGDTVVIEAGGPRQLTKTPPMLFWRAG